MMANTGNTTLSSAKVQFLSGDSEMHSLIRSCDWINTSLGDPESWPQSLRITLNILLNSKFPMFLFWGDDLVCFYNDSFRPSLGEKGKHPAIGKKGEEVWAEIWEFVGPLIDKVKATGEPVWYEDQPVSFYRNGHIEEMYWTFSYSAVYGDNSEMAGVFVTCNETTAKVLSSRVIVDNEKKIRLSVEQAPVAIAIFQGSDYIIDTVNEKALDLWGRTKDEVLNKPLLKVIPELDTQGIKQLLDEVYQTGTAFSTTERPVQINKNGKLETVYVNFVYEALHDADGKVNGIMSVGTDVTSIVINRKKTEDNEEQLRIALQGGEMGTFDFYPLCNKLIWSDKTKELFGLNPGDEVNFDTYFKALHPADAQRSREIMQNGVFTDAHGLYEIEYRATGIRDKKLRWLRSKGKVNYDADGKPIRYTGIVQDITKRKYIESEKQKLSTVLEVSGEFVGIAGIDGVAQYVNPAGLKMLGWESYEGRLIMDCIYPEDRPLAEDLLQLIFTKGSFRHEIRIWNEKTNEPRWIQWNAFAMKDELTGELIALATVSPDISELKETEKALSESEQSFRNIIQQAPLGITILNGFDFVVEMANENYLALVDKKEKDFVGKKLFDALPEVKEAVDPLLRNVLNSRNPYHGYEFPVFINKHGRKELTYFNFVYHPLKEKDGSYKKIIVVASDVTQSIKAKHLLAESEKQFRSMVLQSPIPMTIFRGKNYVVEIANKVMIEDIWRRNEKEVIGRPVLEVFPELKEQKYPELLDSVYKTGKRHSEKESVAYVQGDDAMRKFYLDFEYAPLFDTDGSVSGIIITVNDVTEKVTARMAIEESEQRLRSFVESAPFPIGVYLGSEMKVSLVNQAIIDVWGKGSDIIGKLYAQLLPELQGTGIYEQLDAVYNTGIPFHAHNQRVDIFINGKLKPHYFNYSFTPVIDINGKVIGVMNTAAEVTDLIMANQLVEESEKRFRSVANSVPVFIWMSDADKHRYFFNIAWLNFTGRTMEEEKGDGWMHCVHPDDLERYLKIYNDSFDNQQEYYMEYRLRRHDGEYRWISARGVPRFTSNGVFEGFIGACMDVHDRLMYQQQLKEDEERLNVIITASGLGTWELILPGEELNYSDRYLEILGYEKGTVITHSEVLNNFHPEDKRMRKKAFEDANITGIVQYESRVFKPDGSLRWIEVRGKIFYNELKKPAKIIGTIRDITDIIEQDQQKDFFISMASHELKTPITSIKGYIQLLQSTYQQKDDHFLNNSLKVIDRQVVTLTSLIGDLLDVSKIKTGSLQLTKENFQILDVIKEVINEIKHIHREFSINFVKQTEAKVYADKGRISQVLVNFLTNAVKYSPNSKVVEVENFIEGNNVVVVVKDSGIGISKSDQEKIFERFYRVEGKNEKTYPGFGIGLFIAAEIIQRHDGAIGVKSEPAKGSAFYFSIPFLQ